LSLGENPDFRLLNRGQEGLLIDSLSQNLGQGSALLNGFVSKGLYSGTCTPLLLGVFNEQNGEKVDGTLPLVYGFSGVWVDSPDLTEPFTLVFNAVFSK
jgi:hypothetical protein